FSYLTTALLVHLVVRHRGSSLSIAAPAARCTARHGVGSHAGAAVPLLRLRPARVDGLGETDRVATGDRLHRLGLWVVPVIRFRRQCLALSDVLEKPFSWNPDAVGLLADLPLPQHPRALGGRRADRRGG